jgi:uncharacterized protein (DUF983 family)
MPATTKTIAGFPVRCPRCNDEDGTITMDLHTLDCTCSACGEEFTARQAQERLQAQADAWVRVLRWIDMIPQT